MQVIAKRTLKMFWQKHPQAETPLRTWYPIVDRADWSSPHEIKKQFGSSVDFVGDSRAIFDIGGNKFRLIVRVSYSYRRVLIKFVGTHKNYDTVDPEKI